MTLSLDTVIARAAPLAGLTTDQTRQALTLALGLLDKHAAAQPLADLYRAVPDAQALARSEAAQPKGGGGLFGGLMKGAGGLSGAAVADAMGALDRLKAHGVDRDDLGRLLPAARNILTQATGRDVLGDVIRSVPGVGKMLGG